MIIEDASQHLEDKQGVRKYAVLDVAEAHVARAGVNAMAPLVWNNLIKQTVSVDEQGGDVWEGIVRYGTLERGEQGDIAWSFNIATKTVKITHGLEHIKTYPTSGDPDPHKGAIGVRDDGNGRTIDGCQVNVGYMTWDEEHWYPAATVATHAFITKLETLIASVNENAWRIWQKGELLIVGIQSTGSKNSGQDVGIRFRFATARNKTGQEFGDVTGVDCEGHQHLWIEYEEEEIAAGITAHRPVRVHVERVYDYCDWDSELPLPDPWS